MAIIVAPLVRGRIPTVVENVITCVTPGENIDILVTDHGVAVNPKRPDLIETLTNAGIALFTIDSFVSVLIALLASQKILNLQTNL